MLNLKKLPQGHKDRVNAVVSALEESLGLLNEALMDADTMTWAWNSQDLKEAQLSAKSALAAFRAQYGERL